MERKGAHEIFRGQTLKACEISSTEYHQVVYPLVVLEYFTFIKDMFTDEQSISRNPEKFYPIKKTQDAPEISGPTKHPLQGEFRL